MRTLLVFAALLALAASRKTRDVVKGDFKPYPTQSVGLDLEVKQLKDRVSFLEKTKRSGGKVDGRELKSIYLRLNSIENHLKEEEMEKKQQEKDEKKIVAYVRKHEKELREGGERLDKLENTVDEKGGELIEGVKYIKEQLVSLTGRVTVIEGELKRKGEKKKWWEKKKAWANVDYKKPYTTMYAYGVKPQNQAVTAASNQTTVVPNETAGNTESKKNWWEKKKQWWLKQKGQKNQVYKKPYTKYPYGARPQNQIVNTVTNQTASARNTTAAEGPRKVGGWEAHHQAIERLRANAKARREHKHAQAQAQANSTAAGALAPGFPILNAFWKNQQERRQRQLERRQKLIKEQQERAKQAAKAKAEEEKENNKWLNWAVKNGNQAKKFIKKNPQDVKNFVNSFANLAGDAMANVATEVMTEVAHEEPEPEIVTDAVPDSN